MLKSINKLLPENKGVLRLALAQALMMSVNTLLLTSSAIIGFALASDKSLATLPLAVQFFATMLTTFPASMLMRRYGRKIGFYISTVIGVMGSFLAIYSMYDQSFILFCLSTFLFGVYTGFGGYYRFVAAEISADKDKNVAVSYVLVGGIAAAIIGPNLVIFSKDLLTTPYVGSFLAVLVLYALNQLNFSFMQLPRIKLEEYSHQTARPLSLIAKQPVFIVALTTALFGYSLMSLLMTATPLSMKEHHLELSDIAFVIQWHVLGMFVPSLFTGHLLNKFGFTAVSLTGAGLLLLSVIVNLLGTDFIHYWLALLILGVGWNFLFVSGTTKLTSAYNEVEKAKTQALNDFLIISVVTIASLSAGILQYYFGWQLINLIMLPFILLTVSLIVWLYWHERKALITK